jgi:hypothetical protein
VIGTAQTPPLQVGVVVNVETEHSLPPVVYVQVPAIAVYPEISLKFAVWLPAAAPEYTYGLV